MDSKGRDKSLKTLAKGQVKKDVIAFAGALRRACHLSLPVRCELLYHKIWSMPKVCSTFPTNSKTKKFLDDLNRLDKATIMYGGDPLRTKKGRERMRRLNLSLSEYDNLYALRDLALHSHICHQTLDLETLHNTTIMELVTWRGCVQAERHDVEADTTRSLPKLPKIMKSHNQSDLFLTFQTQFREHMAHQRSPNSSIPLGYVIRQEPRSTKPRSAFDTYDAFLFATADNDHAYHTVVSADNQIVAKLIMDAIKDTDSALYETVRIPLRSGHGREAWEKLMKQFVTGIQDAQDTNISKAEEAVNRPFIGKIPITRHNMEFIQNLAILERFKRTKTDEHEKRRLYLRTIQDSALSTHVSTFRVQKQLYPTMQDCMDSLVALEASNQQQRLLAAKRNISALKGGKRKGKHKGQPGKEKKQKTGGNKNPNGKLTAEECQKLKDENPSGWFKTNKTIPREEFMKLRNDEPVQFQEMMEWRESNPGRRVGAVVSTPTGKDGPSPDGDSDEAAGSDTVESEETKEPHTSAQFGRHAHKN